MLSFPVKGKEILMGLIPRDAKKRSERLMLKLKLQCFSPLIQEVDSLEKTLMLGKIEGRRRRG